MGLAEDPHLCWMIGGWAVVVGAMLSAFLYASRRVRRDRHDAGPDDHGRRDH